MIRLSLRLVSLVLSSLALAAPAMAQFNVVNTSWTVNCVFTTSSPCSVTVTDYVSSLSPNIPDGRLQSRIHQAQAGSTAQYKWVYRYRVDLTQVAGVTYPPSVDAVWIYNFGTLRQYDYNADGNATDHVFVVTSGGLGTRGLVGAGPNGLWTTFSLSTVFAGSYPGGGESSYFWGVVSDYPPMLGTIWVHTDSGWVAVTGYVPDLP